MYYINKHGLIKTSSGATVPCDNSNSEYIRYLAWVSAGNEAQPLPELPKALKAEWAGFYGAFSSSSVYAKLATVADNSIEVKLALTVVISVLANALSGFNIASGAKVALDRLRQTLTETNNELTTQESAELTQLITEYGVAKYFE